MRTRRAGLAALFGSILVAFIADPALAQSADSTTEALIRDLNEWLLYIAVPIAVLVEGILIYTVWKFRNNENPLPTKENRRLEITWTVATALILVVVGIGSYVVLADPYVSATSQQDIAEEQEPLEINVVAQKYYWRFEYPEETVEAVTGESGSVVVRDTLVMPTDRPVQLNITSTDWLHAFHVPGLGLKSDAFPGSYNTIVTKATSEGEFQLYCAEYCGSGHSRMLGTVNTTSQTTFETWLANQDTE